MPRPQLFPVKKVIGFDETMLKPVDHSRRQRTPIPTISDAIRHIHRKNLRQKGYLPKRNAAE